MGIDQPAAAQGGAGTFSGWPSPRIVYSDRYNITFFGLEKLHPFDSCKYGHAHEALRERFGRELDRFLVAPPGPVSQAELLGVHSADYLKQLEDPAFVARVLEVGQLARAPASAIDKLILQPMRWATMGTIVAVREAMERGLGINLSGGYHHASPAMGHGFCVYADVGLALHGLRQSGALGAEDRVVYIDLDAHQGNGVCRTFFEDRRIFIYDQYNGDIFPNDGEARRRIDCDVRLGSGCGDGVYLRALRDRLPGFVDSINRDGAVRLAVYNAGTDVYAEDALGQMNVSADGVLERDRLVLEELMGRRIPTAVVLSGGYSRESYRLVARMVAYALERWGNCAAERPRA